MRLVRNLALAAALLAATGAGAPPATSPFPEPIPAPVAAAYLGVIAVDIDARDIQRRIIHIRQTVPVAGPGPATFLYPEWLPGHHASKGAIEKLAGLHFSANGKELEWRRDPVNVFAFHIDVPAGAKTIEISAQYLSPTDRSQGRIEVTPKMANLQWNSLVLYPAGYRADGIRMKLSLRLPKGWSFASALSPQSGAAGARPIAFAETDLETLVDSPMFTGAHYKRVTLDGGETPVHLNIFGDTDEMIAADQEQIKLHQQLVEQADLLYGARHFDRYDFLLAVTDQLGGIGLEHHRSSENGVDGKYFTDQKSAPGDWGLLGHEYVHSWNGKFRRAADLYTANYDVPMRDSLLWVYEGMTQYWGQVLSARSGMWPKQTAMDIMASTAATYDHRVGRAWRSLEDTTNDPIILGRRPQPWKSWQRAEDYYSEGLLVWLDADTLIRERSGGEKSLDDFARAFFGTEPGRITPLTYTFDDVVAALNAVTPYDWAGFLKKRVMESGDKPPLDGIRRGGWKLVYNDKENGYLATREKECSCAFFGYSIGFDVGKDGSLKEVMWDSPAFAASLKGGDQLIAVNGEEYSVQRLKSAITAAKGGGKPIDLIVKSGDYYNAVSIDYRGGLKIPNLERDEGAPDRLSDIFAAKGE